MPHACVRWPPWPLFASPEFRQLLVAASRRRSAHSPALGVRSTKPWRPGARPKFFSMDSLNTLRFVAEQLRVRTPSERTLLWREEVDSARH
jgi:hypothetical protein